MLKFFNREKEASNTNKKPINRVRSRNLNYSKAINEESELILYDNHLIDTLTRDHQSIVALYTEIWVAYSQQDLKTMQACLIRFKTSFQSHIIKENVKFYVYLEQTLSDDIHSQEVIKDFRHEMNTIAKKVIKFCNLYSSENVDKSSFRLFEEEYQTIKDALLHRIQREEQDLYILYKE